jgi:hypothetical protein
MAFTSGQAVFATGADTTESRALATTTEVLTGTATNKAVSPDAIAALWEKGSDIASAGTISIGEGGFFHITGTTTITDIDPATDKSGRAFVLVFDGALTLTHHATNLILPTGANITTAAGDSAWFVSEGSDAVRCVMYHRKSGAALVGGGGGGDFTVDGDYNCFSTDALGGVTTGVENVAIGVSAGSGITSGEGNVCLGSYAGQGAGNIDKKLFIDGIGMADAPLIWGDFWNAVLRIFGEFNVNPGSADAFRIDNNSTAGNTRMLVWDVDNGTLERVSVGAADSGGTGYKLLRIPN